MILITGCTGYIGSRLVAEFLKQGHRVRGLVLEEEMEKAKSLEQLGLEVWKGNLVDADSLTGIAQGVEVVYHLAGLHSSKAKMENLYVNGTKNLLEKMKDCPVQKFFMAGNGAAYGDWKEEWLTEEHKMEPEHIFGKISLAAEQVLWDYAKDKEMSAIILRIGEVYGPDEYDPLKKAAFSGLHGLGDGQNYTSKIHIDDVIEILKRSLDQLEGVASYNIVDDNPMTQRDYYGEIQKLTGCQDPEWMPAESVAERIRISIHGLRMLSLRMSNKAIKEALNYEFLYPTCQTGLASLIKENTDEGN